MSCCRSHVSCICAFAVGRWTWLSRHPTACSHRSLRATLRVMPQQSLPLCTAPSVRLWLQQHRQHRHRLLTLPAPAARKPPQTTSGSARSTAASTYSTSRMAPAPDSLASTSATAICILTNCKTRRLNNFAPSRAASLGQVALRMCVPRWPTSDCVTFSRGTSRRADGYDQGASNRSPSQRDASDRSPPLKNSKIWQRRSCVSLRAQCSAPLCSAILTYQSCVHFAAWTLLPTLLMCAQPLGIDKPRSQCNSPTARLLCCHLRSCSLPVDLALPLHRKRSTAQPTTSCQTLLRHALSPVNLPRLSHCRLGAQMQRRYVGVST